MYSEDNHEALVAAKLDLYTSIGGADLDDKLFDYAGVKEHSRVLDCGSGFGTTAARAATSRAARAVGIDVCAGAVRIGEENAGKLSLPAGASVEFHQASVLEPWTASSLGGSFDTVLARELLSHLSNKVDAVSAMARKVSPGGRLVISDIVLGPRAHDDRALVDEATERGMFLSTMEVLRQAVVLSGLDVVLVDTAEQTERAVADRRIAERALHEAIREAQAHGQDARALAILKASCAMDASRLEGGILQHCVIVAERPKPAGVAEVAKPEVMTPMLAVGVGAAAAVAIGAFVWVHSTDPVSGRRLSLEQAGRRALDSVWRLFR